MSIINKTPAVSVIIPVYNIEKYIATCLQSVVLQSLNNIEILVINDASTDNSLKIVESFAIKDPRITIINNNKNLGLSAVRNIGLKKACGQYIHFLDGDDYISYYAYEELFEYALLNNKLDVLLFAHFRVKNQKTKAYNLNAKLISYNKRIFSTHLDKQFLLKAKVGVPVWHKLFKKDFLLDNNFFFKENTIFEDILFYWQTITAANNISYLNIPFYYYCKRDSSIMGNKATRKDLDIIKIMDTSYNYMLKNNYLNNYVEAFTAKLLKTYISFFKGIKKEQKKEFFTQMQLSLNKMNLLSSYLKDKLLQKKLAILQKSSLIKLNLLTATKIIR